MVAMVDSSGEAAALADARMASAEKPFRSVGTHPPLRWVLRRWTPGHIWYRFRLPFRRKRWLRENYAATRAYVKSAEAVSGRGPTLVFGDFSGNYGLARGAQYDLPYIKERCPEVEAIDIGPLLRGETKILPVDPSRVYGGIVFLCQPDTYARILKCLAPQQIAGAWRVGRWVWETPLFPSQWRFALDLVHEIWTPSQFCADAFRTGTDLPIEVVPHHVTVDKDAPLTLTRADLGIPEDAFMGLAIMDLQSCPARKNPWAHIEAWKLAFGDDPKAVLVMKVRVGKRTKWVMRELEELCARSKNVRLIEKEMTTDEIRSLTQLSDVFLSLHRSEGFGLIVDESLQFNKYVLATTGTATPESRSDSQKYISVESANHFYSDTMFHYEESLFVWTNPIVPSAAERLRFCRRNT